LVRRAIEQADGDAFEDIMQAIRRTGALQYTRQMAGRECELARLALDGMLSDATAPQYGEALRQLTRYAIERVQ
jgi:octaprenyl-diphosphate synthase